MAAEFRVLLVACLAACVASDAEEQEPEVCPVVANDAGGEAFDTCIRSCWTSEEMAQCCREAHPAVGTDPEAAICLAQAYGISPTKEAWVAVMERFRWLVASTVEDECDYPNHVTLHVVVIDRPTGAFEYDTWAYAHTMVECGDP